MRCVYNGKPMVNSVNGKQSSMEEIFPLVKKYGGVVVALKARGIPDTAGRPPGDCRKNLQNGGALGIDRCDIVVDAPLHAHQRQHRLAKATLDTLGKLRIKAEKRCLACPTSLSAYLAARF